MVPLLMVAPPLRAGTRAPAPAAVTTSLPPFSFSDCVALLDDDPASIGDYIAGHAHTPKDRDVRHCQALADVLEGDAAGAAQRLDDLAHDPGPDAPGHDTGSHDTEDASPEERALAATDATRAWLAADDPEQAENSASYGLTLTPDSLTLRLLRDRAWLQRGHPDLVLTDLATPSGNPLFTAEEHLLKATAERQTGHLPAARADIESALAAAPDDPAALLERGIIRQRQGDPTGAQADWQKTIEQAPDSHEADLARQDLDILASDPDAPPMGPPPTRTTSAAAGASPP